MFDVWALLYVRFTYTCTCCARSRAWGFAYRLMRITMQRESCSRAHVLSISELRASDVPVKYEYLREIGAGVVLASISGLWEFRWRLLGFPSSSRGFHSGRVSDCCRCCRRCCCSSVHVDQVVVVDDISLSDASPMTERCWPKGAWQFLVAVCQRRGTECVLELNWLLIYVGLRYYQQQQQQRITSPPPKHVNRAVTWRICVFTIHRVNPAADVSHSPPVLLIIVDIRRH